MGAGVREVGNCPPGGAVCELVALRGVRPAAGDHRGQLLHLVGFDVH